jgi:hypothetical protein
VNYQTCLHQLDQQALQCSKGKSQQRQPQPSNPLQRQHPDSTKPIQLQQTTTFNPTAALPLRACLLKLMMPCALFNMPLKLSRQQPQQSNPPIPNPQTITS